MQQPLKLGGTNYQIIKLVKYLVLPLTERPDTYAITTYICLSSNKILFNISFAAEILDTIYNQKFTKPSPIQVGY